MSHRRRRKLVESRLYETSRCLANVQGRVRSRYRAGTHYFDEFKVRPRDGFRDGLGKPDDLVDRFGVFSPLCVPVLDAEHSDVLFRMFQIHVGSIVRSGRV